MSLARYALRRFLLAIVVIVGAVVVTFFIVRLLPADPAKTYAGERARSAQIEAVRKEFGLDQPLSTQFVRYLQDIAAGDFGSSFRTKKPVVDDLRRYLPATLELASLAFTLAILVGVPLGVAAAAASRRSVDRSVRFVAISGAAVPSFWLALVAQLVLAGMLGLLPLSGRVGDVASLHDPIRTVTGFNLIDAALAGNWNGLRDAFAHIAMPALVLSIHPASLVIRMTRAAMIDTLQEPYIVAARALGYPERTVLFRYALKNAISPTLTVIGLMVASALTGTVLVEVIFSWPGVGQYVTESAFQGDFPVVVAVTLLGAVAFTLVNLVIDLIQATLDPRIRLG
jgi:peptide/nickel transport system permease protein